MSNPAVISLARKNIQSRRVWLDDNIGESLHIHIDAFRFEFSNEEFNALCEDLCDAINELVRVPGFNCHKIEPKYFDTLMRKYLPYLQSIKLETARLKDMICPSWKKIDGIKPLPESLGVRIARGEIPSPKNNPIFLHAGQTDQERFNVLQKSLMEHGYPYNGYYIYLFTNNCISDGHHRAAILWHILGDSEVPVMRLYLSDDFKLPPDHDIPVPFWKKTFVFRLARRIKHFLGCLLHDRKTLAKSIYHRVSSMHEHIREKKHERTRKKYFSENSNAITEINDIFSRK